MAEWFQTLVFHLFIAGTLSQTLDDAKALRKNLFETNEYDKTIIPLVEQSYPIYVYVSLSLFNINGLNEVKETLTITGYLTISWFDENLTWDPSDYGGIYLIRVPQDDIWKPDISLQNSALDYTELGASTLKATLYSDGEVTWYPFQVLKSTCRVDITYFPFDEQTCPLTFVAWSYTKDAVQLDTYQDGIFLDEYEDSALWKIIGTSWTVKNYTIETTITFTIKMKRKPLYFVMTIVTPILLLAVLNVCVFSLPCESGERAGFSITVLLALTVFLTVISSSLPANSEAVSIFSVYVIIQTVQSTIITLMALITIRLSSKETEVPRYLVTLTRFVNCKGCKKRKRDEIIKECKRTKRITRVEPTNATVRNISSDVASRDKERGQPNEQDKTTKDNEGEKGDGTRAKVTWQLAVRAIDFTLFVVLFGVFALTTLFCAYAAVVATFKS